MKIQVQILRFKMIKPKVWDKISINNTLSQFNSILNNVFGGHCIYSKIMLEWDYTTPDIATIL